MLKPQDVGLPILPTTMVGSLPKPGYLLEARKKLLRGEIDPAEVTELAKKATAEAIKKQEELGLDLLVDGEFDRGDMVTYFAERWDGFKISGLVRSYGNRYYRKPIAVGPIGRKESVLLPWYEYVKSLTDKPFKVILTGPYTMAEWSYNEYYPTMEDFVMALAKVVREEVMDLVNAGARFVQIDEPAITTREEDFELGKKALAYVTEGLEDMGVKTFSHICYGDFPKYYPRLLELPVQQLDLELKNSNFDMLPLFKKYPFTKEIGAGVIDVHSHRIEEFDEVVGDIKKVIDAIGDVEKVYVDPDCGLKTRTEEETWAKVEVMIKATHAVRKELGLE